MEVAFTTYAWLNLMLVGFFFGIGFALANAFLAWIGGLIASART
jgi:hypothetical protein